MSAYRSFLKIVLLGLVLSQVYQWGKDQGFTDGFMSNQKTIDQQVATAETTARLINLRIQLEYIAQDVCFLESVQQKLPSETFQKRLFYLQTIYDEESNSLRQQIAQARLLYMPEGDILVPLQDPLPLADMKHKIC